MVAQWLGHPLREAGTRARCYMRQSISDWAQMASIPAKMYRAGSDSNLPTL